MTTSTRRRGRFWALAALSLFVAGRAPALDTEEVRLGEGGSYDDAVKIERSASTDEMVFTDAVAGTATLAELKASATAHGALTGLDGDDHPQYLNEARHDAAHDAAYNDALAISPDPAGNATLGDHAGDSTIHLRRDSIETLTGKWIFDALIEFAQGLKFSDGGSPGDVSLAFEATSSGDAEILFDDTADAFALNRDLGALGVEAAKDFGAAGSGTSETVSASASAAYSSTEADGLRLRAVHGQASLDFSATGTATGDNVAAGVRGKASLTYGGAGSVDPLLVGVVGVAESDEEIRQVGVAALLPDNNDGSSRIGLVAGVAEDDLATASLPSGGWAAYLLGNTRADGQMQAEQFAVQASGSVLVRLLGGSGSPEGSVSAPAGSLYMRTDGGAGTTLYVKESGTGNTGWAGK